MALPAIRKEGEEVPSNSSGPYLTGCFQGMTFKMQAGNPLAPGHGVGTRGELRAVHVHHPDGKHFSTLIGKAVSMQAQGSSV